MHCESVLNQSYEHVKRGNAPVRISPTELVSSSACKSVDHKACRATAESSGDKPDYAPSDCALQTPPCSTIPRTAGNDWRAPALRRESRSAPCRHLCGWLRLMARTH